ncbi:MAG: hypothetical protein KDK78_04090, partial [Chlamydiia bacterium]|nr:hypothetical protein [Chlamydiia bacterium]
RAPVESCKELLRTRLSGIRTGELLGMDPNSEASQRLRHASLILAEKLPQMDPEVRTPHLLRLALDDGTCFTGTEYLIHECAATITGGLRQDFASSPQTQIVRWWDECKEAVALQQCHRALWLANDPELTGQSVHILNAIRAAMAGRLLTLGDETVSDTSENGIAFPSISTDVFAQSMLIQLVQGITMEEAEELPPKKYARNLIEYSDHYQKLGVKWLASTFPPFLAEKVNSVFETGLTDADSAKLMNAWVRELAVHFFKNLPQGCIRDEIRKEVPGAKEQAKKKGEEITEKAESVRDIQVEYTAYKEELAFLRDFQEIGKRKREETEEESKVQRVQPPIYAELMEIIEEEIGFLPIYYHEEFNLLREEQRFFQENVIFNAKVKCLMEHPAFLKALCGPEGYFEVSGGLDLQNLDFMEHELRITERGAIALAEMYLGWEKKV